MVRSDSELSLRTTLGCNLEILKLVGDLLARKMSPSTHITHRALVIINNTAQAEKLVHAYNRRENHASTNPSQQKLALSCRQRVGHKCTLSRVQVAGCREAADQRSADDMRSLLLSRIEGEEDG